jgi:hypothetical protein
VKALLLPAGAGSSGAAGLFVALFVVWAGLAQSLPAAREHGAPVGADAPAYVRIARGLASGTLELPPPDRIDHDRQQRLADPFGTPYALGRDGRLLPKHSVAFAALLVPGVAVGGYEGAVVVAILLGACLAGFVTARCAAAFGVLPAVAAASALFVLTPGGRWIVTGVNIDTVLAGAMVCAFAFGSAGQPVALGLLIGLSPLFRPTAVVLLLPAVLALPRAARAPALVRVAAGLLVGAAATALVNTWLWGAPWRTGYDRALVFLGETSRLAPHSSEFGSDPVRGLVALLFDPAAGFLVLAPVTALAFAGYSLQAARRTEWVAATVSAALSLLLLAPYSFVQAVPAGNYRFGFPLLVSAVPPLSALLAAGARLLGPRPSAAETAGAREGQATAEIPPREERAQPSA